MVENLQNLAPPQLPNNGLYSLELIEFISLCLQTEPERRASVQQLLEHPWMKINSSVNADLLAWYKLS